MKKPNYSKLTKAQLLTVISEQSDTLAVATEQRVVLVGLLVTVSVLALLF
jgi:hypothetical protein